MMGMLASGRILAWGALTFPVYLEVKIAFLVSLQCFEMSTLPAHGTETCAGLELELTYQTNGKLFNLFHLLSRANTDLI